MKPNKYQGLFILLSTMIVLLFGQCRPYIPTPKPRGYFKVEFPEKQYQTFDVDSFPFSFDYPVYAQITRDSNLMKEAENPYWINVYIPSMDATIYLSYKEINRNQTLEQLVNESFVMSEKHGVKADYIKTPPITTEKGYKGFLYVVGGDAASAYQFFLTNEQTAAMRGSLYFNVSPNADSLSPMYDFLKKDLDVMIETFEFKR